MPTEQEARKTNISLNTNQKKMAKEQTKQKQNKTFISSIAFSGLPVALVGDPVTGAYVAAVAKLSKEDQAKYVG